MMQNVHYNAVISSPVGHIGIQCQDDYLLSIDLQFQHKIKPADSAFAARVVLELNEYFSGKRSQFTLPVVTRGTPFQQQVWQELVKIPPGTTLSYGEVAERLATGARAVGNACRANPLPLVIPCHRVLSKTGLGGFAGTTAGPQLELKQALLQHESRYQKSCKNKRKNKSLALSVSA